MSKKKPTKGDLDDLDDVLGDLLGDDDDVPKKKPSANKSKAGTKLPRGKPNLDNEEFYRQLAAQAKVDEVSDVSDADPDEMAKTMDGLDDMDAYLFSGPKKPGSTNKASTLPAPKSTAFSSKPPPATKGNDLDFPARPRSALDELLFTPDTNDIITPRPKSALDNLLSNDLSSSTTDHNKGGSRNRRNNENNYLDYDDPLAEVKPKPKPSKANDFDFDEDDPLAGLLSSEDELTPRVKKPKPQSILKAPNTPPERPNTGGNSTSEDNSNGSRRLDIDRPPTRSGNYTPDPPAAVKKGKSRQDDIMFDDDNDLLEGMGMESPRREKEVASSSDEPRKGGAKSILNDLLGTAEKPRPGTGERKGFTMDFSSKNKPSQKTDEDVSFGGYQPSVLGGGGSRPNSRRSVRFEEEGTRPISAPPSHGNTGLDDLYGKDDGSWLDMARPGSDGGNRGSSSTKKASSQENMDWFGYSSIGSPDTSRGVLDESWDASEDEPYKPSSQTKTDPKSKSQDDWLGSSQDDKKPAESKIMAKSSSSDKQKSKDWMGATQSMQKRQTDNKPADDWLSGGQSKKHEDKTGASDWLGDSANNNNDSDDFLGLGKEIDPDSLLPSKPKSPRTKERSVDDLFKSPPTRSDLSSTFPKASVRNTVTPPSSAGNRKSSLQDSPRGVTNTLDAILKAAKEKQEEKHYSVGSAGIGATTTVNATKPFTTTMPTTNMSSFNAPAPMPTIDLTAEADYMKQMAEQQAAAQKQLQMQQHQQQEAMRAQHQQRLQQIQMEQERMMQQQQAMMSQISTPGALLPTSSMQLYSNIAQPGFGMSSYGIMGQDYESRIQKLEMEKRHLESILEKTKQQHNEEMTLLEEANKKRIELIETTFEQRESRLKAENELLSKQGMDKLHTLERERGELVSSHLRKQSVIEEEKEQEISRLKEHYRQAIQDLRREQDEALERLKKTKHDEMEAVVNRHSHSQTLHDVMDRVGSSVRDLEGLHHKVETSHLSSLSEREHSAINRDNQLKMLQERLERQQHENAEERARLQGLVTKLELQLTEQSRDLEQGKWKVRQEESRLQALQQAVDQEKQILMTNIHKDKNELDKAKDRLLQDQRTVLAQLQEERRELAEERAQFNVSHKLVTDQQNRDNAKTVRVEVEVESTVRALNDEKTRLADLRQELTREKARLEQDRFSLQQDKELHKIKQEELESLVLKYQNGSREMEQMSVSAVKAREEGQQAYAAARKLEGDHMNKLQKIQADLTTLRQKEKQIAQERLTLAREKQEIENIRGAVLCVNCSTPVRDARVPKSPIVQNDMPLSSSIGAPRLTSGAQKLFQSLPSDMRSNVIQNVSASIEADRSVRMWKMSADKDKMFLQEETLFLQALKYSPYHKNGK